VVLKCWWLQAAPLPSVTIIVDTQPPTLRSPSSAELAGVAGTYFLLPTFSSGAAVPRVCIAVSDLNPTTVTLSVPVVSGRQSVSVAGGDTVVCLTLPSGAPDGNHTVEVAAVDAAGNPSVAYISWWVIDSVPPVTSFEAR
jgi:hypothetical protein